MLEHWYYILAIPLYKLISNLINLHNTKKIHHLYIIWIETETGYAELTQEKQNFSELIKKANIIEPYIPTVQPMGYGQLASFNASLAENFPSSLENFVVITNKTFLQLIGIFKKRCWETFNPLYWLNLLIYLPQNLLQYLGFSGKNIFTKLLQLLWWIIGIFTATATQLYPDLFRQIVEQVLQKFSLL